MIVNRIQKGILAFLLLLQCVSAMPLPVFAEDPGHVQPTVREMANVDQAKLQNAKDLTDWLQKTLQQKQSLVAVVARKGGEDVKKHDATGMAHAGIAVYDPRAQTWLLYNLLNDSKTGEALSGIWRTAPLDFFYGQTGYEKDALVMLPDVETQQRLYEAILNGNYKKLHFTPKYNLLSKFDSPSSLNCTKWILMNLAAARIDDYNAPAVLNAIREGFSPGKLYLNGIEKFVISQKPNVRSNELPHRGPVEMVTIESLYRSPLFQEKLFYSGKSL